MSLLLILKVNYDFFHLPIIAVSQFSGSFAITRIGAQRAVFSAALDDASSQEYQSVVSDVTAVVCTLIHDTTNY